VNAFLFFRNAYLANVASLRPMLDFMPWVFLFFVPAIAMRSLAEDNRGGMLEIVLAHPLSEAHLVLGKYLGVVAILAGALASTLLIPIGLSFGAEMAWGPVIAQYVGALLLAAAFAGVGVWGSSLTRSQITAFILGVTVMFVLILVGLDPMLVGLPPTLGTVAARLGVLSHFESTGRGLLDLRDVVYFLSVAAVFLALAYAVLMRRRLAPGSATVRQLRLGSGGGLTSRRETPTPSRPRRAASSRDSRISSPSSSSLRQNSPPSSRSPSAMLPTCCAICAAPAAERSE
jgi:ABC-2 type transport system permease protein